MKSYYPDLVDHFPKTRRGHGRGLGHTDKQGARHFQVCQVPSCGETNPHQDRAKNIADWEDEHGIELASVTGYRRVA